MAIVGLVVAVVAVGVGDGAGARRGGVASNGRTKVGDGDFSGGAVGDALFFFFTEAVGEPFFFFLEGVGVFFAADFFLRGDAFAFGVGDLAGIGEVCAAL